MTETTAPTAPIYIGWQNRGLAASEPQGPETAEDAFRLALTGSI